MNPALKKTVRQFLPRTLKPHHIRAGPLQRYQIVTSWHDYPAAILGTTERPLLEWFAGQAHVGETWLDIGAHYGYTALALARLVGAKGRVFAFEPMLTSAGCIARTRELNQMAQLTILPLALGNPKGFELEHLPIVRGMVDSTLTRNGNGHSWSESLLVVSLDEVWKSICGANARIDGVKVDVQGMELNVLRGMQTLLKTHQPKLVVEVHSGVSRTELVSLVSELGYTRPAIPIEPIEGETSAQFVDDRSYAFLPKGAG